MDISIVIPLLNEVESLPELHQWITRVMTTMNKSYEIIFIDDGSNDGSWDLIVNLSKKDPAVKGVKFTRNYGKSAALNVGFERALGAVVITMDADLQDSPEEIPGLYEMIVKDGFDLVSGWKKKRFDPITKTIPTKIYNGVTGYLTGIKLHDMNCGLKAYKNAVIKNVEVYGEMHRYIPVIAKWAGFSNIGEKVVVHQARKYGYTKFGISRFVNGFLDLFSIMFIGKFGKRPMHFFGGLGTLTFFLGTCILLYLTFEKIFINVMGIADRPLFYLGILLIIVGLQLFVAGFLAELITRNAPERNDYKISEEI
ncbi:MAG: glycosyltransferase family 2 protein [Saprospiraceae bacterium]|nr:glycosyltransferase family 2 protein [Saprospiraceae bacterium]MBK8632060.1 glycosyltransferase family 2 protein [Saprospiraceae bacterium]MBP7643998.1 glycosyltransferase family 2 protein [Saprospiraceae bacterium]HMS68015.1 glycosyltransferase family 2 protein [Saprospiraceae bacterium]